jgi:membrane protease YdiL (CAAX protease family)
VSWTWEDVGVFELWICAASWFFTWLSFAVSNLTIQSRLFGLGVSIGAVCMLAASITPGLYLLRFSETRESIKNVTASPFAYPGALLLGLVLPFSAHLGRDPYPVLSNATLATVFRVFLVNALLSPFWEEVAWRGYLLRKVKTITRAHIAVLVTSGGWVVWHCNYIYVLYESGVPLKVLAFLPFQYFGLGVIIGSMFYLLRNSLLPCVLFHAGFNASVTAYFRSFNRISEPSLYLAETVAIGVIATTFFYQLRRTELSDLST